MQYVFECLKYTFIHEAILMQMRNIIMVVLPYYAFMPVCLDSRNKLSVALVPGGITGGTVCYLYICWTLYVLCEGSCSIVQTALPPFPTLTSFLHNDLRSSYGRNQMKLFCCVCLEGFLLLISHGEAVLMPTSNCLKEFCWFHSWIRVNG